MSAALVLNPSLKDPVSAPGLLARWREEGSKEEVGINTGFPRFDERIRGLKGLVVLGGLEKQGKSTFALQVAWKASAQGVAVLYYNRELDADELGCRLDDLARLYGTDPPANLMFFMEERMVTQEGVQRRVKEAMGEGGRVLLVVDSVQKMVTRNLSDRRAEIDAWWFFLETLKNGIPGCAVLAVSELTRTEEEGKGVLRFKESRAPDYAGDILLHFTECSGDRRQLTIVNSRRGPKGLVAEYRMHVGVNRIWFEELPDADPAEELFHFQQRRAA